MSIIELEKGKHDESLKVKNQQLVERVRQLEEECGKLRTYREKNEALN